MKEITWKIPIRLVSESNRTGEHWSVKSKRHRTQQLQVKAEMKGIDKLVDFPCEIVMVRLSPRMLDDDNLVGAFKHIRDQIADCILPGQAKGRADGDLRLTWKYEQEKSKEKFVKITLHF